MRNSNLNSCEILCPNCGKAFDVAKAYVNSHPVEPFNQIKDINSAYAICPHCNLATDEEEEY